MRRWVSWWINRGLWFRRRTSIGISTTGNSAKGADDHIFIWDVGV